MAISYRHRFIFIHVPKVAGISITEALRPYADPSRLVYVPLLLKALKRILTNYRGLTRYHLTPMGMKRDVTHRVVHAKAKELKEDLPRDVFEGFHKFAFVRNPWDWQVSTYYYNLQIRQDKLFKSFGSFENYLDWRVRNKFLESQKEFLVSDSGEILVDFIGHFETLHEDFETVCNRLGIESNLPHENRSTHRDFREYYTPHAKALVAEAFKGDIEFFGYQFDNPQRLAPILGRAETERLNKAANSNGLVSELVVR